MLIIDAEVGISWFLYQASADGIISSMSFTFN
jgi:hypothetical protein